MHFLSTTACVASLPVPKLCYLHKVLIHERPIDMIGHDAVPYAQARPVISEPTRRSPPPAERTLYDENGIYFFRCYHSVLSELLSVV